MRVTKHLSEWACVVQVTKGGIATDFFGCSCPLPSHPLPATKRVWPITKKIKKSKNNYKKKMKKKACWPCAVESNSCC